VLSRQGILTTSRKVRKTKNHPEEARGQTVPLTETETMKRTKKQLAERKAKAAEIAAMYTTVAGGGRMQEYNSSGWSLNKRWAETDGPDLASDLSVFRVIPAPKKP
jgi:hypothetical protein